MHEYDRSSKWLIQHHGASILRLAGITDVVEWEPLQAEVVQPRGLPDGFLRARRATQPEPGLYVIEVATYPEPRIAEQAVRDAALVYLNRGIVPEVIVLVLRRRGRRPAPRMARLRSESGQTSFHVKWRMIELWEIPAEVLLAAEDVGVLPWVSLSKIDGPPEPVLRRCRERIDREAPPDEHESLLAVSQVLARLRYHDETLFQLLGGRKAMLELPFLEELKAEWIREAVEKEKAAREAVEKEKAAREVAEKAAREADHEAACRIILEVLGARFGSAAKELRAELAAINDDARLGELARLAGTCKTLEAFHARLRTP
ncbi:hypothetical protein OJF2_72100 [Aquisphaera giovannonii]|uniref:Uncharacterized protein n=1 Tax=Aquisphaera giovannonii TaxID=406548 RepID=A0A5B9WDB4_9BACT|nr:hypothetical protein [Aquisphaera giovannonii]QEH38606.1 hypothetical protein OJF2_72100 [Aquisphaera giovannonii]